MFGLLFSRNSKKTHTGQSISQVFSPYLKRNHSQTFKSSSWEKLFFSMDVIVTTCFRECSFHKSSSLPQIVMLLLSLKQVFWSLYLHINNIMLISKFQNKALVYYMCSVFWANFLFCWLCLWLSFILWLCHIFLDKKGYVSRFSSFFLFFFTKW